MSPRTQSFVSSCLYAIVAGISLAGAADAARACYLVEATAYAVLMLAAGAVALLRANDAAKG